jgi:hypothetical protein
MAGVSSEGGRAARAGTYHYRDGERAACSSHCGARAWVSGATRGAAKKQKAERSKVVCFLYALRICNNATNNGFFRGGLHDQRFVWLFLLFWLCLIICWLLFLGPPSKLQGGAGCCLPPAASAASRRGWFVVQGCSGYPRFVVSMPLPSHPPPPPPRCCIRPCAVCSWPLATMPSYVLCCLALCS